MLNIDAELVSNSRDSRQFSQKVLDFNYSGVINFSDESANFTSSQWPDRSGKFPPMKAKSSMLAESPEYSPVYWHQEWEEYS